MATEYAAQVTEAPSPSDAHEGDDRGQPVPGVQPLEPERHRDERDEDRERPEHEGDRCRGGEADGVGERQLVQPDSERGHDDHEADVATLDPEGSLPGERERREDDRSDGEAKRRISQRFPAVRECVLDDREVEAPEEHGHEQEDVCGEAVPHGRGG
jgi:hypothetical protein